MLLEVKVMTGARAGKTSRLEKPVISVGRNPDVDIRFDPTKDLDVSGRHAEFRSVGMGYELHDLGSTNGTFVNGERVEGMTVLRTADTIRFGANGPEVEVSFHVTGAYKVVGNTEERVALAVKKQTAGLRRMMMVGLGIVAVGIGAAYFLGQRASAKQVEDLRRAIDESDSRLKALQNSIPDDTALVNALNRDLANLKPQLNAAKTDEERKAVSDRIAAVEGKLAGVIRMDLPSVNQKNAPGVALLVSVIKTSKTDSGAFAGTAFALTSSGLLLTNRHNVRDENGNVATQIAIKFRNDSGFYKAHLVKIPPMGDSLDLALIQLDDSLATYPTVVGVQAKEDNMDEGAAVAIIGFPLGYETAQEGRGGEIAKTSIISGTVSKRTSTILQVDAFAAHGSSGSPIISARGLVVGVVWGGPKDAGGRIVYAVPRERIVSFLPEDRRASILK